MNILPKKSWHVRTKENIARVRRDEKKAAEEEKEKQIRIQKAETEARINFLRKKARKNYDGRDEIKPDLKSTQSCSESEHINFFTELETKQISTTHGKTNKEHDKEITEEKEKYEKSIGYLTYLGQDTNEATGNVSWYNNVPERLTDVDKTIEVHQKSKSYYDPLNIIKKVTNKVDNKLVTISKPLDKITKKSKERELHKVKDKKSKKSKKHKKKRETSPNTTLAKLRQERLLREKAERLKTEKLLAKIHGDSDPVIDSKSEPTIVQKYNNQFFPEYARQNQIRHSKN